MATGGVEPRATEAIVLAGGAGARFGGNKLTSPWHGGLLIDGALGAAFAAPARSVIVVTGADGAVAGAARAFADQIGQANRLRIVHAHDHAVGMAATLRAGIAALPDDAEAAFVFLGDMPRVPLAILPELVRALAPTRAAVAPVCRGRRGHPVLFARTLFPRLASLAGDRGARSVLDELGNRLALVETGAGGVLFDVDTREDL